MTSETPRPEPTQDTRVVLGPIRHACHSCGTCCSGWRVQVRTLSERERITRQAKELGIADPIVDGSLRRVEGVCVFLREDRLCAIHARFGEEEKPIICQHFPRRSRHSEDGVRIGADPGCSATWRTFDTGPEMALFDVTPTAMYPFPPEIAALESALIAVARTPGISIGQFIASFAAEPEPASGPPPALTARLLTRLKEVTPYLVDQQNGRFMNAGLEPLTRFLVAFDGTLPPWPGLSPRMEAYVLDTLQRHLFLRLGDEDVPPLAHALLVLGGALAAAYCDPTPEVFGPAMAAWSRLCRLEGFWVPIMPTRAFGDWILKGGELPSETVAT